MYKELIKQTSYHIIKYNSTLEVTILWTRKVMNKVPQASTRNIQFYLARSREVRQLQETPRKNRQIIWEEAIHDLKICSLLQNKSKIGQNVNSAKEIQAEQRCVSLSKCSSDSSSRNQELRNEIFETILSSWCNPTRNMSFYLAGNKETLSIYH